MQDQRCPRCGMSRDKWTGNTGQGVQAEGLTYCCTGCAGGTGCNCSRQ